MSDNRPSRSTEHLIPAGADPRSETKEGSGMEDHAYNSVHNTEGQYSIWRAGRPLPAGWVADGFSGTKEECLDHIEEVWTDITPISARQP